MAILVISYAFPANVHDRRLDRLLAAVVLDAPRDRSLAVSHIKLTPPSAHGPLGAPRLTNIKSRLGDVVQSLAAPNALGEKLCRRDRNAVSKPRLYGYCKKVLRN